jgi:hypothetical protein
MKYREIETFKVQCLSDEYTVVPVTMFYSHHAYMRPPRPHVKESSAGALISL